MLRDVYRICVIAGLLCAARGQSPALPPNTPSGPITTFGVTVFDSIGLRGDIYLLRPDTTSLPNLRKMKPVGAIYTNALNIPPRDFKEGFPGVTDRFEWFAIDYTGGFWIENPGKYRFLLASDDGSKLYVDNKLVIDNDGIHAIQTEVATVKLKGGAHRIRISYFQGPRTSLALVLGVSRMDEPWRVFNTRDFLPPR